MPGYRQGGGLVPSVGFLAVRFGGLLDALQGGRKPLIKKRISQLVDTALQVAADPQNLQRMNDWTSHPAPHVEPDALLDERIYLVTAVERDGSFVDMSKVGVLTAAGGFLGVFQQLNQSCVAIHVLSS